MEPGSSDAALEKQHAVSGDKCRVSAAEMRFEPTGGRFDQLHRIAALMGRTQGVRNSPRGRTDERQITRLFGNLNTAIRSYPPELGIAELECRRSRQLVCPGQPRLRLPPLIIPKLPDSCLRVTNE